MTGSINKSQTEFPNNLQSKGRSKSRTNSWLPGAVSATVDGLGLAKVGTTFCEYSCIPVNAIVGVGVMRMISPR
jgi:hypothetical protein